MDFSLTDEQKLLKDSVDRLLAEKYDFAKRKQFAASELGWSREMWQQYADLGLLGVAFEEKHGGIGGWAGGIDDRDGSAWPLHRT